MPVSLKQEGKKWRVVDPDGSITKNKGGTDADGGGHESRLKRITSVVIGAK